MGLSLPAENIAETFDGFLRRSKWVNPLPRRASQLLTPDD
jgi:hypothetical protein